MVLAITATGIADTAVSGAGDDLVQIEQSVGRLEVLTQRVEALSAVKRLQHAYGHYAELGLWHDFADLFADSGIGYYTQGALDREGIRSLFLKEVGGGRLGLVDGRVYPHISMQPVVTLAADGQSAKGRWRIMAMLGGYGGNASWSGGIYENQYVRENGAWKFKEVRYLPQYSGRYENPGWTPTKDDTPFDFDDSRAGRPILDEPDLVSGFSLGVGDANSALSGFRLKAEAPDPSALGKRLTDLATRAQRLRDEIEVTNLQHTYGYHVDRKMWRDASELFASDGTMEIGLQGVYVGRASIRRGLTALARGNSIDDHVHLQTIVTVSPDGRTARARGTDLGFVSASGRALLTQSIFENEFVKQGDAWKFKAMHVYPRFIVDAAQGWGRNAIPAPGPSREFPPDRPPTETYEIYPRFHIAPLHFDHPVTGRPPRYPEGVKSSYVVSAFRRTIPDPVNTLAALERLLALAERSVLRSLAYHASENLATAYGYTRDTAARSKNLLALHQVVQPVITVSSDARSARIRARLFQLGNSADGSGAWTSGIYDGAAADQGGVWRLSSMKADIRWTAPSRGGWRAQH